MNREHKKQKWTCRECDPEWNPLEPTIRVTCVRDIDAAEAAEMAASEFDDKEWGLDFDGWTIGNVNATHRYIEIETDENKWRRFVVKITVKLEYGAQEVK